MWGLKEWDLLYSCFYDQGHLWTHMLHSPPLNRELCCQIPEGEG